MNDKFKELEKASAPLIKYLKKYDEPYTTIIITEDMINVVTTDMAIPIKKD